MDLMDFYERQQKDFERFDALRDKEWQKVLSDNEKLVAAHGGKEGLTEEARKIYDRRINSYNAEWSKEGGSRYNDLLDQHERQREHITGKSSRPVMQEEETIQARQENPDDTTKDKFKNQSERMTDRNSSVTDDEIERQQLKEKIARQQAAIKKRKFAKTKRR